MTSEELHQLPDATLIAIARNCPKYEQSESLRELVMELAKRLDSFQYLTKSRELVRKVNEYCSEWEERIANPRVANLLLRD